jgi:hypothetical protein
MPTSRIAWRTRSSCARNLAVAIIGCAGARSVGAQQAPADRLWYPWIAASIGAGAIDVTEGSANVGPFGEAAAGVRMRNGLGAGLRLLQWSELALLSDSHWSGTTVVAFASYAIPRASALSVTGGLGPSRVHRNPPDVFTIGETVGETGVELDVPRERRFAFRMYALREWNLGARMSGQTVTRGFSQWYVGAGLRLRLDQ